MFQKIICLILSAIQSLSFYCTTLMSRKDKTTLKVNEYSSNQIFEGFGTSMCWWAQRIDTDEKAEYIADMLFDKKDGLGLNTIRYDIGGGSKDDKTERVWDMNRRTEGFFDYDEQTGDLTLNFDRDANARRVLDKAIEHGVTRVVLFANSPHFSLTSSGHASGGLTENFSNLPKKNYQKYVTMFLDLADEFVRRGYPIYAISPINEPQWSWGGDWVGQEGCHYTPDEVRELMEMFVREMKKRGCKYILSGFESGKLPEKVNSDDNLKKYFSSCEINSYCKTFSGHSYWLDNDAKTKKKFGTSFKLRYPTKKFEMTEWCELPMELDPNTIDSALRMAKVIADDLAYTGAVSWSSWTAVNGDGVLDFNDDGTFRTYMRYYAYRQFANFIEPGMTRRTLMNSTKNDTMPSVSFGNDEKDVIVLVNSEDAPRSLSLTGDYSGMKMYTTDVNTHCEKTYDGEFNGELTLGKKSIATIILERK